MTSRSASFVAMALAVGSAAAGCSDNAILELGVQLPPRATGYEFAKLELLSGETTFDAEWAGPEVEAIALGDAIESVTFSIEADGEEITRPLNVRMRYCERPDCDFLAGSDATRSEVHVRFPRAFFQGIVTQYRFEDAAFRTVPSAGCIADCPSTGVAGACPCIEVHPCRVGSVECIGGDPTTFCSGADGLEPPHKCDPDFTF